MDFRHFRFWCQTVLPLVYDDSLSYYENLCKIVAFLNKMIDNLKGVNQEIDELKKELAAVQKWIDEFDTTFIKEIVEEYIATMIFVEITDAGYIVYNVPEKWHDITFNTTGLDIILEQMPEYGHLVLSY